MGRKSTGHLYKQGRKWYLEYTHVLRDEKTGEPVVDKETGNPIKKRTRVSLDTTHKEEAKQRAEDHLRVFWLKDEKKRIQTVKRDLADKEEEIRELEDARREKLTVEEAWARFEADPSRPQSGPVALRDYSQRWGSFVKWTEANRPGAVMEEITPDFAKDFARSLSKLSPNRYSKIIQTCRLVFRVLSPDCNGMANPFADIQTKGLATRSHRELTEEELRRVCGAATGEMRTLFAIGLYTALRLGDCATLDWGEVDFRPYPKAPNGRIVRLPNKTKRKGKVLKIPIHRVLRTILEETPSELRVGPVVPELCAIYTRSTATLSKRIQKHFADCKITTTKKHKGQLKASVEVGFHSLRHTFVSLCASNGTTLAVVQELCGHGSPAIQRHYIHLGEEAATAAVDSLPSIQENALPSSTLAELRHKLRQIVDSAGEGVLKAMLAAATPRE